MSSEGSDSTICSDIVFREFVNSYSCDEIVLDVFYNGCFLIYPLKYGGEALELKISKGCGKMYEMANLHGLLEVYVSHIPQLEVTEYYLKNLCVDESDAEVTSQLRSHQKIKKEIDSYSLEEMIAWEQKESQSPCYLISSNPLKTKRLDIDLKGKSLLDDFESVEGEGLGSSSSSFP
nr:transposase, MuDR, MULE transposase domain protein [Tanacetum cinerariifolium]